MNLKLKKTNLLIIFLVMFILLLIIVTLTLGEDSYVKLGLKNISKIGLIIAMYNGICLTRDNHDMDEQRKKLRGLLVGFIIFSIAVTIMEKGM